MDLTDAYRDLRDQQYQGVIARCDEILKREPDNIHAWILTASAWTALGRKERAEKAWKQVQRIEPAHAVGSWPVAKSTSTETNAQR
jgi:cytochrome c-type biogenesis protein CcmH/NrfG